MTITAAERVIGAILETDPGGGATGSAFLTSEMESGISIGRTGLKLCFDFAFGFAAEHGSAKRTTQSETSVPDRNFIGQN
jgi:hypothetical protein